MNGGDAVGASGAAAPPHLAPPGRLTPDAILRAPQFMNCLGDYEIDLRGNKASTIENLGVTQNQFDTIDLSDNAIARLDGFPRLPRARTVLAHNNRVAALSPSLASSLPSLTTLGLAGNRLARLADLDPLASCPRLTHLICAGCPVARHPSYRAYLAWKCRRLRSLDGARVSDADRAAADAEFGGEGGAAAAAAAAATVVAPAKTFDPGEGRPDVGDAGAAPSAPAPAPPTEAQLAAVRAAIEGAATLEEVAALEAALAAGDGAAAAELAAKAGKGGGGGERMEEG